MRKLKCQSYLAHADTVEKLCVYVEHLDRARNLPNSITLGRLAVSQSFNKRAYEEVCTLARQVQDNYGKRGQA